MGKVPPTTFAGTRRFQVQRRLGQGGMGTVFAALDKDHGTTVALKTLNQMTADGLLLFKNEFRALADIHHENLISFYELVEDSGQWFFTMELLPGSDFISYVRPLPDDAIGAGPDEGLTSDLPFNQAFYPAGTPAPSPAQTPPAASLAETPLADGEALSPAISLAAAQIPHAGQLDELRLRTALVQLGRGLFTLHAADKIHRDIKPHNITTVEKS